ncbi:hypothetical protein KZO74_13010 [Prevotella salivae]|jgi:heat shock protein dnaJ-like protein|uniref:hypothetical protein n=1 Tax=Prevotellaceae TaxID=171552 RepID=UPI001C5E58D0|nr:MULTISPECIES: hypothetical protein [Prevotellaceae]MBW4765885.1 hypothetical protein [Segatella salivae]
MNNPYTVLGINQNATKIEIVKAQIKALRLKKYDAREIAAAQKELHSPARRLAVDFTYPILDGIDNFEPITTPTKSRDIDINKLNPGKYNS